MAFSDSEEVDARDDEEVREEDGEKLPL